MEGYPDTDYPHAEPLCADPTLEAFYDDGLITDVLQRLKSGKEATLYCCRAHPSAGTELLAAKVYRPLARRSFRNDAIYQEGRFIGDARLRRAYEKKTLTGRNVQFGGWVEREFEALCILYDAGADVPAPVAQSGPALLMEYLGDEHTSAPMLKHVHLGANEASAVFRAIMRNVELFLACDLVHADLSAFNVLYWDGKVKIIDFPQAVDAFDNPSARSLLARDIRNVCRYFARYGVDADPSRLADDLWERFLGREL